MCLLSFREVWKGKGKIEENGGYGRGEEEKKERGKPR